MTAIRTEQPTKRYGDTLALDSLDLDVREGGYGYLGPNGAEKTTTIRLLLDLHRPTAGRAELFGIDCWRALLSGRARAEGITTFTALMLATNREMMDLFEELDPMRIVDQATGTVEVEVPIPPIGVAPALRKLLRIAAQHDVAVPLARRDRLPTLGTQRPQERA